MLLGSGRQSPYKGCIHSTDHVAPEVLAVLASAAAILHSVRVRAQPWRLGNGEYIGQDERQGNMLYIALNFQE